MKEKKLNFQAARRRRGQGGQGEKALQGQAARTSLWQASYWGPEALSSAQDVTICTTPPFLFSSIGVKSTLKAINA